MHYTQCHSLICHDIVNMFVSWINANIIVYLHLWLVLGSKSGNSNINVGIEISYKDSDNCNKVYNYHLVSFLL